jgi:hypothetical protein
MLDVLKRFNPNKKFRIMIFDFHLILKSMLLEKS